MISFHFVINEKMHMSEWQRIYTLRIGDFVYKHIGTRVNSDTIMNLRKKNSVID